MTFRVKLLIVAVEAGEEVIVDDTHFIDTGQEEEGQNMAFKLVDCVGPLLEKIKANFIDQTVVSK